MLDPTGVHYLAEHPDFSSDMWQAALPHSWKPQHQDPHQVVYYDCVPWLVTCLVTVTEGV